MIVTKRKILIDFYKKTENADSKLALLTWLAEAEGARWENPHDIKKRYPKASIVGNNRVVFDICHNKYRLIVKVDYQEEVVEIRYLGTHKDYDRINAKEI